MASKSTIFYRNNTAVSVNFSTEAISSDGAVVLVEKLERKHKLLNYFCKHIPDCRNPLRTVHGMEKLLKQRVYMLMQGYEDANDVFHLQNDPLFKDILEGDLASQPALSRFENGIEKRTIFDLCYACIDRYVSGLSGRSEVIIDIDCTDDPTHGAQQLSLFNGYYGLATCLQRRGGFAWAGAHKGSHGRKTCKSALTFGRVIPPLSQNRPLPAGVFVVLFHFIVNLTCIFIFFIAQS